MKGKNLKNQLHNSNSRKYASGIILGALLSGLTSSPAIALLLTKTDAQHFAVTDTGRIDGRDGQNVNSNSFGEVTSSSLSLESGTGGQADAFASYGALTANVIASAMRGETTPFNTGLLSSSSAFAQAEFSDLLTITSGGRTGSGLLRASLRVDADLSQISVVGSGGSTYNNVTAAVDLTTGGNLYSLDWGLDVPTPGDPFIFYGINGAQVAGEIPEIWDVAIPFNLGEFFDLRVEIGVYAYAFAGVESTAEARGSMANGVQWQGISAIELPDGTRITDFVVDSESGYNWRGETQSVPSPSTLALLFVGAALLCTRKFLWPSANGTRF